MSKTGGELIADVLVDRGVKALFTLCGGHIAPILVAAKQRGIRVIDTRDEASAAFAADASSRLTGIPGVAAVTAGPGVTNVITAIKNAQMAQSPLILLGGATGTILKGRGSLQDIDQLALFEPHVKWQTTVERVRDLPRVLERAFDEACLGVPGPVFVECPVDLLYQEALVRNLYGVGTEAKPPRSLGERALRFYLSWHLNRQFRGADKAKTTAQAKLPRPLPTSFEVRRAAKAIEKALRPVLVVGSQAALRVDQIDAVAQAVGDLGLPFYLSGMARGLVGAEHPRWLRHKRKEALKEADVVILAGVPSDFRLDYGRHIGQAKLISVNLSDHDLMKNRTPQVPILADPATFLLRLNEALGGRRSWDEHVGRLRARDQDREVEIARQAEAEATGGINPLFLCREIDRHLDDDSIVVADGGDFVATASYIVRPRGPLRWLDPGVFGTLGVGGGFALGAKTMRPSAEVWLLWGDGSSAYSLAEFDACARHGLPIIAVVGNDAGWTQIAREQVEILGDDCGTALARTDYHKVAEGYGGVGLVLERREDAARVLTEAKTIARSGRPVLINAWIGKTDFRKGSLSM